MNGKLVASVVLLATAVGLCSLSSCGRDQQLVSISIEPSTETFGDASIPVSQDAGLQVQLRALGTYIHPPVTKDITTQVTWTSNDTQMMTVDANGLLTAAGIACGSTIVSATVTTNKSSGGVSSNGALITATMTGNVTCFTGSNGQRPGPIVNVGFSRAGIRGTGPLLN